MRSWPSIWAAGPSSSSTAGATDSRRTPGRPPPSDAYAAPRGYSVIPEADVQAVAGAEIWNGDLRETGEG